MPPITTMTTTAPTTIAPTSTRAEPIPRARPRRSSDATSGDATAATTAAVMTGVVIVLVSASSQTAPTTSSVTPTASHADVPRSRSHGGVENSPVRLSGSNSTGGGRGIAAPCD